MLLLLPVPVILFISLFFSVVHSMSRKLYNKCAPSHSQSLYAFHVILGISCGLFIFLLSIDPSSDSPLTDALAFSFTSVALGALFGLLVMLQLLTYMYALSLGPFSYTSVIVSLSTLIAALSGLFYGETIDVFQYIGMGIMVLCIVLSTNKSSGEEKRASIKWVAISLISCVFNGGVGVMQKIHQSSSHKDELTVFLLSAFAFITVSSLVLYIITRAKERKLEGEKHVDFKPSKKQALVCLLSGVTLSVPHVANLYLAGQMPSAVFFPIINTGSLVLTTIAASLVFKERLSPKQWVGLAFGIISSLFVSGTVSAWLA